MVAHHQGERRLPGEVVQATTAALPPVSFSLLLLSEEPPSALFLGTHPSWNVGVEEEEEGRRRSSGEKKRGLFLMSQLLRGCRKWGEGLFWAALFSEAAKASVPVFFSSTPKEEEKGEKMLLWKDATLSP